MHASRETAPYTHTHEAPVAAADIVLWLDLADANQLSDDVVCKHLPPGAQILRLTKLGVAQVPSGTPTRWSAMLDAIDRLVRHARRIEQQSPGCRYWVTGRAGLPAFFHLGHRLSKIAAVTLVHQDRNGEAVEVMHLQGPGDARAPYFERTPWPIPYSETTASVAFVVSSLRRPADLQIAAAFTDRRKAIGALVRMQSPRRLDATTIGPAMHEIEETLRETCDAHPMRSVLAAFIAGPSALAFLVGRAINPRACRDVEIFEFDGSRYTLAYQLPYPAVPDRARVLWFSSSPAGARPLALDEEIRALHLAQSAHSVADRLEVETLPATRPRDLDLLRTRAPAVLHFSGHGDCGELLFQDDHGRQRPVETPDLVEILRLAGDSVRLVVLAACHSASHAESLLAHVDCVVAMRGEIDDTDARHFATAFYQRLAEGNPVQDSFDHACLAMRLQRPVLSGSARPRDIAAVGTGSRPAVEPPELFERDPGLARELVIVRRR